MRTRRSRSFAALLFITLAFTALAAAVPSAVGAQEVIPPRHPRPSTPPADDDWGAPRWTGDVAFLATNALVAGMVAGVSQRIRGGSFRDAFARGAAGGAVAYAGRRVAVAEFDGAGLLGRQLSAVGVSMARNAGDGRPSLERLLFPLGPVHLYVDRSRGWSFQPKLHVVGLAQAVRVAMKEEAELDVAASLSAGAPVFRAPGRMLLVERWQAAGLGINGVIVLGEKAGVDPARLFAHERVHILQGDYAFLAMGDPVEGWLLERSRYTAAAYRYLDLGGLVPLLGVGAARLGSVRFYDWPHEVEARFLADQ